MRFGRLVFALAVTCVVALAACRTTDDGRTLVVFNAGSLARPLRAALDTFALRERIRIAQENSGSLEAARKITELGRIPDFIALADVDVFPQYLVPAHVEQYTTFARNRMVLGFTNGSFFADEITTRNWPDILVRPLVEVGRSDPELDPGGYRALMVWQLMARVRRDSTLPTRLAGQAHPRNVRPKEADLVAMLQAGELDYIWTYESMAKAMGFNYIPVGDSVDLSQPRLARFYANVSVTVRGPRSGVDSTNLVTIKGAPILYAFAVPTNAPHRALGERFAEFLKSAEGIAILRAEGLDALDQPTTLP